MAGEKEGKKERLRKRGKEKRMGTRGKFSVSAREERVRETGKEKERSIYIEAQWPLICKMKCIMTIAMVSNIHKGLTFCHTMF